MTVKQILAGRWLDHQRPTWSCGPIPEPHHRAVYVLRLGALVYVRTRPDDRWDYLPPAASRPKEAR